MQLPGRRWFSELANIDDPTKLELSGSFPNAFKKAHTGDALSLYATITLLPITEIFGDIIKSIVQFSYFEKVI